MSSKGSSYGSPENWATILQGAGEGAGTAMQGASQYANSQREAKEAKRRTLSNLVNQAMKRKRSLFNFNQENAGDLSDFQTQSLQQMARGFVDSLKGSTGY